MRMNPLREIAEQVARRFCGRALPPVTLRDTRAPAPAAATVCPVNAPTGARYWVAGVDTLDDAARVC